MGFHVVQESTYHVWPYFTTGVAGGLADAENSAAECCHPAVSALVLDDEPEGKCEAGELSTCGFDRHADMLLICGGTQL
jgi:hypothetical protein